MSFFGNLKEGVKKKLNFFSVGKDIGQTLVSHAGPVLSYALAPTLGPLAGIASSVISGALNFGLQWSLQKWEKWDDRKEVNKAEKGVKKSIAEFMKDQTPKVENEKRGKLADWLKKNVSASERQIDDVRTGKIKLPNIQPELPKDKESKKQIKKIQEKLEKWTSID